MLEIRDLLSLRALASSSSFDAAARELRITPGAMSQRVKQIEDRLGQIVVVRTSPIRLTHAGETLLRLAQQVDLLLGDTIRSLTEDKAFTTVTVAVNNDSLASWFFFAVADFASRSAATLDVRCVDQAATSSLLQSGSVMAAISAEVESPQGCESVLLGGLEYMAVCSPNFLEQGFSNASKIPSACPMIMFEHTDSLSQRVAKEMGHIQGSFPIHYLPDSNAMVRAAAQGLGWAVIPALLASEAITRGELVTIDQPGHIVVPLYLHYWRLSAVTLKLLVSCIRQTATLRLKPLSKLSVHKPAPSTIRLNRD